MSVPPSGCYAPSVLFLQDNEDIDIPATKSHILRLAQGGVCGILVQGSNGEAQFLSHEERKQAIRLARDTLDENGFRDVLVIAGTGAQSTRETIKLCFDAKEAGASHVLVLTPSTWPPQMTADNIIQFHQQVADASPLPYMVYNFPVVTAGIDLDSDTIAALAKHPNIVGTKLSCGNIGKLQRLSSKFPSSEFAVFAGRSDFFAHGLLSGSAGTIAATVNILPKIHGSIFQLVEKGKISEAMDLQAKLGHGDWAVQKIGGIGGVKTIVSQNFGYGKNVVHKPLKSVAGDSLRGNSYYKTMLELIDLEKSI
ncbi:hypothetical protein E1B28_007270 [Marasmius oreades]|uniref:Aldolase n=1 Tax=Marasmius oreades TaxID=181124 RepID=A0A9P7UVP2_9AGAR|nr:uncharacterized protein E1B28_007270 [Marasmius oreades]KAG7093604.1 hypothetical protein E1B28_007270 [Marasmius oreades]